MIIKHGSRQAEVPMPSLLQTADGREHESLVMRAYTEGVRNTLQYLENSRGNRRERELMGEIAHHE